MIFLKMKIFLLIQKLPLIGQEVDNCIHNSLSPIFYFFWPNPPISIFFS